MKLKLNIKEIMEKQKRTLKWLEAETEIRYATLHDLVNQKRDRVSCEYLARIMKALNIYDMNDVFIIEDKETGEVINDNDLTNVM